MTLLDERAHAGAEHLDQGYVAGYDEKAGVHPDEELALLRDCGLDAGTTLVDLGAGSGVLAVAAAPHCRRVVAVDPSPAMLAAAGGRVAAAGTTSSSSEPASSATSTTEIRRSSSTRGTRSTTCPTSGRRSR
jgi:ribosomal protein L11 methylase PrmA